MKKLFSFLILWLISFGATAQLSSTLPHDHGALFSGGPLGDVTVESIITNTMNSPDETFNLCEDSYCFIEVGNSTDTADFEVYGSLSAYDASISAIGTGGGIPHLTVGVGFEFVDITLDQFLLSLPTTPDNFLFGFSGTTSVDFEIDNSAPFNFCTTTDCTINVGNTSTTFNIAGSLDVDDALVVDGNAISADGVINITSGGSSIASVNNNNGNNVSICNLTDCTINLGAGGSTVNVNGSPLTGDVTGSSAAQDGYIIFNSAIMMTWGDFDISGADFSDSETFAVAYESTPWSCTVSVQEAGSTNSHNIMITGLSATTITVQHLDDTGGETPDAAYYQCFGETE